MSQEITIETARDIIATAFLPLECRAEIWDYHFKLKFAIVNGIDRVYEEKSLTNDVYGSYSSLKIHINGVREYITNSGIVLNDWSLPQQIKSSE